MHGVCIAHATCWLASHYILLVTCCGASHALSMLRWPQPCRGACCAGGRQEGWHTLLGQARGLMAEMVRQGGRLAHERRPGDAELLVAALRQACEEALQQGLQGLQGEQQQGGQQETGAGGGQQ